MSDTVDEILDDLRGAEPYKTSFDGDVTPAKQALNAHYLKEFLELINKHSRLFVDLDAELDFMVETEERFSNE